MERKTGLWKKTAKSGLSYYFGQRDGMKVTLFKNKDKRSENDPDLNVIVEIEEAQEEPGDNGAPVDDLF